MTIFDSFQNDFHYGWVVDKRYDSINMLSEMQKRNPVRFKEFEYSNADIYHYLDRVQQEQNVYD